MSIEPDYNSLDPEEKTNRYLAMGSVALGVLSLCAALVPICGGSLSLAGIGLGLFGLRADSPRMAQVGIGLCIISLVTAITYGILVAFAE
ncbi:MAG: hypothetical protein N2117_04170 [Anaerolineales bacterium]|nr:hypothetical protein [Anaerolineales bacterium]MCX7754427.1 hypothetical protein [Anaerolineales bacterium]MDW8276541.1 hypothetical protein [Anaerolineales bacterium]